jgi:yersiniabactin nonribosomal peptide synthetase
MAAPGAYILFIESTRNRPILLTTAGFFEEGFRHIEDGRNHLGLPLMSAPKWREVLVKKGFSSVLVLPEYAQQTEEMDQHLIVAQAPQEVCTFNPENLYHAMRQKLPDYMVPTNYVLLDKIPFTANGKVDRKALSTLYQEKKGLKQHEHVPPSTETQKKIASSWREVLRLEQVGIENNFFALGGDSLRAIQCVTLLKEDYEMDLLLQDFLEYPTIHLLAQFIEQKICRGNEASDDYEEGVL